MLADVELKFGEQVADRHLSRHDRKSAGGRSRKVLRRCMLVRGEYDGNCTIDDLFDFYRQLPNGDKQLRYTAEHGALRALEQEPASAPGCYAEFSFDAGAGGDLRRRRLTRRGEKLAQRRGGFGRRLLGQIMPARQRLRADDILRHSAARFHQVRAAELRPTPPVAPQSNSTGQSILRPASKSFVSMSRSTPKVAR